MRRVGEIEAIGRWSECLLPDNKWLVYQSRNGHRRGLGGLPVVAFTMGFGVVFE